MSFNRLPYDKCAYKQHLYETIGPGVYMLGTPANTCTPCHSSDPYIRLQSQGASLSRHNLIDVDSELIGINRNNSRCPTQKYIPACGADGMCGANIGGGVRCQKSAKMCIEHSKNPIRFDNCFEPTENTKLSNPPCTLRGTGWNRWEWLPLNPQDKVEIPFDFQINSKIVAKDNHRPCIPKPLNQYATHPTPTGEPIVHKIERVCPVPLGPPSTNWQSQSNIDNY